MVLFLAWDSLTNVSPPASDATEEDFASLECAPAQRVEFAPAGLLVQVSSVSFSSGSRLPAADEITLDGTSC